jgi:hypothetical protein
MKAKHFIPLFVGFIIGWGIYQLENHTMSSQNEDKTKSCANMSVWHPDCKVQ